MILVLVLSTLIGVSLGALGGGGTILTVPILMYAAHLEPKEAIAISLLVVSLASGIGAIQQRAHIDLRTGLLFGSAGMIGAYAGGRAAALIPGDLIVALFTIMMITTAAMMIRSSARRELEPRQSKRPIARILLEGVAVGAVTGLVGAGGGFLVVPALVLLGGLPMKRAIATSLLVIAMKSLAGFAGYIGHVDIDVPLAAMVSGAAAVGVLAGGFIGRRITSERLKKGFAILVLAMAAFMIFKQLPLWSATPIYRAVFVERWPWWAGGLSIALVALAMIYWMNQMLGVSTGCAELGRPRAILRHGPSWRLPFLGGIVLGGALAGFLSQHGATYAVSGLDELVAAIPFAKPILLLAGGVLIGFGARRAGGCTSGHSIVGVAQGARSSLIATIAFLVGGAVTTQLMVLLLGGFAS